jgi:hypothetical protein
MSTRDTKRIGIGVALLAAIDIIANVSGIFADYPGLIRGAWDMLADLYTSIGLSGVALIVGLSMFAYGWWRERTEGRSRSTTLDSEGTIQAGSLEERIDVAVQTQLQDLAGSTVKVSRELQARIDAVDTLHNDMQRIQHALSYSALLFRLEQIKRHRATLRSSLRELEEESNKLEEGRKTQRMPSVLMRAQSELYQLIDYNSVRLRVENRLKDLNQRVKGIDWSR